MMTIRGCLTIVFITSVFISFAQTGRSKIFRTTSYVNGIFYRHTYDTLQVDNELVDIYFFRRYFDLPYNLPEKLTGNQHKSRKISVWHHPDGKKDFHQNWENTYTYDSIGRVISYSYSGCVICSSFPYLYTVVYNSKNQVKEIWDAGTNKERFKFFYDFQANIVKLEKYVANKLETVIVLLN